MNDNIPDKLFIDNQWIAPAGGKTLASINPADESVIGEVACAGEEEVSAAVASAKRAFGGEWRRTTPWERGRVLMKISHLIKDNVQSLADMEMRETGKPISAARGAVSSAARYFEFYAGVADKIQGTTVPLGEGYIDFTLREALGVTAHILPWNVPLNMLARGVAPALAAGCTAVVKPAEQTPHGALQLAEIFQAAGLPAGVVNVINGYGEDTGALLASHPGIDGLTFTGSVDTGRKVMQLAAEHIKPVVLELGGKSPILVFDDAEPDVVAAEACKGIYSNTGQYCDAGSRLLLSAGLHDAVVEKIVSKSRAMTVGMPADDPNMGPLISAEQYERVCVIIFPAVRPAGRFWPVAAVVRPVLKKVILLSRPSFSRLRLTPTSLARRFLARCCRLAALPMKMKRWRLPTAPTTVWRPVFLPKTLVALCVWRQKLTPALFISMNILPEKWLRLSAA